MYVGSAFARESDDDEFDKLIHKRTIQNAIGTVTEGRTSFVIAHRLSTITDSDIILAVRDGKIVEKGTHKELMDKKGYYYSLVMQQYDHLEEGVLA